MPKKMLIDSAHPEETRVVVLDGQRVDEFDFETATKRQLRGNIYLAKVTRVEPALQACFVEYGGNRHGFLAFGEIHPDYYQIPVADREALKAEFDAAAAAATDEDGEEGDDEAAIEEHRRRILTRRYRIQEVIRRRQIMLVQVVKEERGGKGAALTTYLSLAGRYCVLMPNTGRGGGISRKITNSTDRKRLKKVATDLDVPGGMGLIIRTAGAKRTKTEIKRDYEYLIRAWENIRDTTLRSVAPALIYEESSIVKRAIRDLYDKDVDEVLVEGESGYKEAKDFVRMLMPSHAKRVLHWKGPTPIFTKHGIERQLESVYNPIVNLKSGGYLVINQTEALVSIDVNSGRSTRERNIEQTALKTNLEAAEEAARQMRLRDLAGLIVIDFIDMEESKNDRQVEKRMKDCLRFDRARVQMGKISGFGLLELSRQRRRTGVLEGSSHVCPHCQGAGRIRSVESCALKLLRALDDAAERRSAEVLEVRTASDVALYVLNEKREALAAIEEARAVRIRLIAAQGLAAHDFEIAAHGDRPALEDGEDSAAERETRGRTPRPARVERPEIAEPEEEGTEVDVEDVDEEEVSARPEARDGGESRSRRRRGRRGGKRRREDGVARDDGDEEVAGTSRDTSQGAEIRSLEPRGERGGRKRRRRRGRGRLAFSPDSGEHLDFVSSEMPLSIGVEADEQPGAEVPAVQLDAALEAPPPKRTRRPRRSPKESFVEETADETTIEVVDGDEVAVPDVSATAPLFVSPSLEAAPAVQDLFPATSVIEVASQPSDPDPVYEPDQEKRDRFFARLSRWGKKA